MPKSFFCHAGEDKPAVEAVYQTVISHSPDLTAWLDKYEILAGQSLIDRIAAGMDESDKFIIFLSPVSVTKPWVKKELRRAIMREIDGVDPNFIIPVLIGEIDAVPPFLEDKKYIPIFRQTEDEWLPDLVAAIRRILPTQDGSRSENVVYRLVPHPGEPNKISLIFEARFWTTKIAFGVATSQDIVKGRTLFPSKPGMMQIWENVQQIDQPRAYGRISERPQLVPNHPVEFELEFAVGVDAGAAILEVALR